MRVRYLNIYLNLQTSSKTSTNCIASKAQWGMGAAPGRHLQEELALLKIGRKTNTKDKIPGKQCPQQLQDHEENREIVRTVMAIKRKFTNNYIDEFDDIDDTYAMYVMYFMYVMYVMYVVCVLCMLLCILYMFRILCMLCMLWMLCMLCMDAMYRYVC